MPIRLILKPTEKPAAPLVADAPKATLPTSQYLDTMFLAVEKAAPVAVIPWWLMASYTYYIHDFSLLSDGLYDRIGVSIRVNWDRLEHYHKHLILPSDLEVGSLYRLKAEDYPMSIRGAAQHLAGAKLGKEIYVLRS